MPTKIYLITFNMSPKTTVGIFRMYRCIFLDEIGLWYACLNKKNQWWTFSWPILGLIFYHHNTIFLDQSNIFSYKGFPDWLHKCTSDRTRIQGNVTYISPMEFFFFLQPFLYIKLTSSPELPTILLACAAVRVQLM